MDRKRKFFLLGCLLFLATVIACNGVEKQPGAIKRVPETVLIEESEETTGTVNDPIKDTTEGGKETEETEGEKFEQADSEETEGEKSEQADSEETEGEKSEQADSMETEEKTPEEESGETAQKKTRLIVIDPGHQAKSNSEKEPNGPGATELKAKVSAGTAGVSTGRKESELNLEVSLLLRDVLVKRGYTVIMVRETQEINISNAERAMLANEAGADAFLRIHADGSSNQELKGTMTICQTSKNPYNAEWYEESRRLSELLLDEVVAATGSIKRRIWETDTMTGINWAQVPSTILEMGYMTNPEEDERLSDPEYQKKIVEGVANALDRFFR